MNNLDSNNGISRYIFFTCYLLGRSLMQLNWNFMNILLFENSNANSQA